MTTDASAPERTDAQPTAPASPPPTGEVHAYQAEMQQLLHIIVHSLYSDREIFLRELISNSSDALNKLKFETLTRKDVRDVDAPLDITLSVDKTAPAVTVSDSGIGMTRDEMIANLGTIARSGTLEWVKAVTSRSAPSESAPRQEMIGQFGVGFYSVFMVAKRVVVDSCPADPSQPATRWVSEGGGSYQLFPSPRTRRGTEIRVELKAGCEEYASSARVEEIVKRYSAFVPHPIQLEGRRLNAQEAIWVQAKEAVSEEQYREFYKFLTRDSDDALQSLHFSIDAPVQFRALLYIPKRLTNEVLYSTSANGLQLYASRVMIQEECQDLLPTYLRFFRGVVDSEDLPLNVSREMVQRSPLLPKLRTTLTGRILRELKALADANAERYRAFWHAYGKVMKEGVTADLANRDKLLELARFHSSLGKGPDELTTLKDYVSRMREGQKEILYFSGPSREAIEHNPNLEFFRKHGLEVLFLSDRGVDDFMMASLHEFEGKPFASIDNAKLDAFQADQFKSDEAPAEALSKGDLDSLMAYLVQVLGERVSGVSVSKRLVDSPATLVNPEQFPGSLQKVMRMIDREFKETPKGLEINAGHALIRNMARLVPAAEGSAERALLNELAEQLLDNCLLVEGQIEHPERMIARIQDFMTRASAAPAAPAGTPAPGDGGGAPPLS